MRVKSRTAGNRNFLELPMDSIIGILDEEQSYNVKCLVEKASWFGFYSVFYNAESPFEVEIQIPISEG